MMKPVFLTLIATFLIFTSPQTADARDYFGAIAVAPNGAYGISWDYSTRGAATNRAMNECRNRARGCRSALWFRNACGALAMNDYNDWATAWGSNRGVAQNIALRNCNNRFGGCYIKRWACTSR